jgi:carbonic anhydrase
MNRSISLLFVAGLVACDTKSDLDDTGFDADTGEGAEESCEVTVTVFDYSDQGAWSLDNPDCAQSEQSPVDVLGESLVEGEAPTLVFNYGGTPLKILNNGHSIEYEVEPENNLLLVDGEPYNLAQFHFHAPSEHRINGETVPMEMHLVHKQGSALAVVALFILEGEVDQPWFAAAGWDGLPEAPGDCVQNEEQMLDLDDLIHNQRVGDNPDMIHYSGSLTTPPCTEGVEWFLMG